MCKRFFSYPLPYFAEVKEMKRLKGIFSVLFAVMIALGSVTVFAASETYNVKELNMTLSVPNDMLAVMRESEKTDSFFSNFDLDYEDFMNSFESNGIYFQAVKQDASLTLTVTMSEDKNSKKIDNYNNLKDSELKDIMNKYLNDKAYKSGALVKCNNLKYIYLTLKTKSGKKTIQAEQYCTVVNGMNILLTLDAPAGKKLKSADKEMFKEVINSTHIEDNNFFTKYKNYIIYGGVTLFGIIVVVIVLIILLKKLRNPNRKNKHLIHELAHEHRISETTRIPTSKTSQHTQSFMKNYKPVDETDKEIVEEVEEIEEIPENNPETVTEEPEVNKAEFEVKANIQKSDEEPVVNETPLAEKIVSNGSKTVSEPDEEVPIAQPMEFKEKEEPVETPKEPEQEIEIVDVAEDSNEVDDYFEEVPEKENMYAYSDVGTAVDEYSAAKEESRLIREERRETADTILNILKAIGRGILAVLSTIWMIICYLVIHIKYFCINVYRAIKKSRAKKKRMKIEEQRRRNVAEQRRRQREAELARRRQNANRNEGDLVKVRSSGERRPAPRTAYPSNRRPQQRPQNRRPQQRSGQPPRRRPRR